MQHRQGEYFRICSYVLERVDIDCFQTVLFNCSIGQENQTDEHQHASNPSPPEPVPPSNHSPQWLIQPRTKKASKQPPKLAFGRKVDSRQVLQNPGNQKARKGSALSKGKGRSSDTGFVQKQVRWNQPIAMYQSPKSMPGAKECTPHALNKLVDEVTKALIRASKQPNACESNLSSKNERLPAQEIGICADEK